MVVFLAIINLLGAEPRVQLPRGLFPSIGSILVEYTNDAREWERIHRKRHYVVVEEIQADKDPGWKPETSSRSAKKEAARKQREEEQEKKKAAKGKGRKGREGAPGED